MAAAKVKNEKPKNSEELAIKEKLNDFLQKNRLKFLAVLGILVVILIGFIIGTTVVGKIQVNALTKIDGFNSRYQDLKKYIGSTDSDAASKQADIGALLDDLNAFAAKSSGFAAARAYTLSASILMDQKKWADAEKAWSASAKAASKSYLAPISIFNAAVAAEEQGNIDEAITLYNQTINYENSYTTAARAQFSIGRLEESRNNKDAALEAYKALVSKWPSDAVWGNLAQSRIVVLSE